MNQLTRKIFIAFSLISIIPLLVLAYLMLPRFLPTATYVSFLLPVVFITAIIVVLGLFLLVSLSKNVNRLSSSANIIARGDLSHSVQVRNSQEVAELADSLNKIAQRLREDMNDLETHAILVERANRELSRLNKLKSEFVSMVSHELRAPLINIKQSSSLILESTIGQINEEQKRCLVIVNHSADRLLKLISDLLDISKIEAGKFKLNRQMISIGKVVQEAAESLERWREVKKISLKLEIESNLPDVYADPDRVNQILVNLLSNAIKFTPAGGQITIKAKVVEKGDFLEISVRDTGIGIPPEQLDKIFERFKYTPTTPSAPLQSIGLGLSITREIVKMHGGRIWVESKLNEGSKFSFLLPAVTGEI